MFKKNIGKRVILEDLQNPSIIKHALQEYGINAPENMLDKFCNDIQDWLIKSKVRSDYGLKASIDSSGSEFRVCVTRQQTEAQFIWSSGFIYGKDFRYNKNTKHLYKREIVRVDEARCEDSTPTDNSMIEQTKQQLLNCFDRLPNSVKTSGSFELVLESMLKSWNNKLG